MAHWYINDTIETYQGINDLMPYFKHARYYYQIDISKIYSSNDRARRSVFYFIGCIAKWLNAADCKSVSSDTVVRIHLHPPLWGK